MTLNLLSVIWTFMPQSLRRVWFRGFATHHSVILKLNSAGHTFEICFLFIAKLADYIEHLYNCFTAGVSPSVVPTYFCSRDWCIAGDITQASWWRVCRVVHQKVFGFCFILWLLIWLQGLGQCSHRRCWEFLFRWKRLGATYPQLTIQFSRGYQRFHRIR